MYSKVIYIVKTDLHYYPPCMAQIRYLKELGVNVEVWFASSNKTATEIMDRENIPYFCLGESERVNSKIGKIKNWYEFRSNVSKKLLTVKNINHVLFWAGTAESAIPLIGVIDKYTFALTMLELLDDKKNSVKRKLFGRLAKKAQAVIACEETRAYIMRYWYGLNALPYVMPNKPYELGATKFAPPSTELTKKSIEAVKGKKFLIFQGIYQKLDYMREVAYALKYLDQDFYFVLMGFDLYHTNAIEELKNIYDKVIELTSLPAPLHLEVTSHAYIGLAFYDDFSLNQAFCAPNKIYEYAGFGIPIIGNKIPGLENSIGKAGAGECVNFLRDELSSAIVRICDHYDIYSENALKFYGATDNRATMKSIIQHLDIKTDKVLP